MLISLWSKSSWWAGAVSYSSLRPGVSHRVSWTEMKWAQKKRLCQRIHTHACPHWHPRPQPWLSLGLWTHHRGFWVEPQHIHERLIPQDREGTTAPLASCMCGHVTRKFSNWPILFSYDTFSKIIPISFHFWSSHQTSYFLWFGDLNGYSCGPKWILGSSLQSLSSSNLSPPVIPLPSPDRENGSFFSSNFLWVVSLHLILRKVKCSRAAISTSHFLIFLPSFLPASF